MVLPDGGDTARDLAAPAAIRPPSPSYLREQMGRGSPKETQTIVKKSLGSMSQRQGLQRATTAEDSPHLPGSFVETDNDSDSGFPDAKKWTQAGMQRSFSIISASTISLDLDAIPEYKYDDGESDIFTVEGAGSGTATPTRSVAGDVSALNGRPVSSRRTSEKFSAELSRRAELILANAKKRLNLMDQNLKGARALTAENLQRATSLHVHETSYANRYLSSRDNGSSEQTLTHRMGHNRNRSDIPQMHSPVQARHAMIEDPLAEESEDSGVRSAGALRTSKSQELPRRSRPFHSTRNVSMGDQSTNATSDAAAATDDLKKQVQSLNKRISMLRERTKEDSMKRQSFLNERGASPFTNAEADTSPDVSSTKVSRWSADSEIRRQSVMNPVDALSKDQAKERRLSKRRSKKLDWGPAEGSRMSRSLKISRFSLETEASLSTDEEGEVSSVDIAPITNKPQLESADQAHEDREDAFDYHNFFLHSSLGRAASSSDSASASSRRSSQASDDTARGPADDHNNNIPTINGLPDLESAPQDTPEKLRSIERTLQHRRLASFDSSVSGTSFATAAETAESRAMSPVKQLSTTTTANAATTAPTLTASQLEVPKPAQQRPLSMQVAARVAEIEGPRAAVCVAAASDPDRPPLGLKDKALLFMLMEAVQGACAKLQDPATGMGEAGVMRRRLEQAKKVLEGSAPVV